MTRVPFLFATLVFLAFWAGFQAALLAQAPEAAGSSGLKIAFEDRKLALENDLQAKRAAMLLRYAEALGRIQQKFQAEGNLEAALRVQKEAQAAQQATLPPWLPGGEPLAEKANARRVVETELQKIESTHQAELGTLCDRYLQALENHKKTATQAGELDRASAIQAEIARVTTLRPATVAVVVRKPLSPSLAKGLVLHYAFEEKDATQVRDSSPSGNHGVIEGGDFIPSGKLGGAFAFKGRPDRIALSKSLPDSAELTVCVWVNYRGDATSGGIFCDFGEVFNEDVMFALNGDKSLHIRADKSGGRLYTNVPLRESVKGAWRHLAWVMEKDQSTVYIDGRRADRVKVGGTNLAQHGGYVGFSYNGLQQAYFLGELDEVMVWQRALTGGEVGEVFGLAAGGL